MNFFQLVERSGVIGRNDIGFLLWEKDQCRTQKWALGSRMKTPTLPMWVTKVNGQLGILFNPNKELMRSYHAENRYSVISIKRTVLLNVLVLMDSKDFY